ncbi:MAG: VOC family protein [Rikenellaceae bacterium]
MKKILSFLIALIISSSLYAQPEGCPQMYGLSKMTFRVSSPELAVSYYSDFLGFDHAFDYESIYGPVMVFKINDRQFFEFLVDTDIEEKGNVISTTIQTPDVAGMHAYIKSKGYEVTDVVVDGAGNNVFTTKDDYGKVIEFSDMNAGSLHMKTKGQFLSPRRISTQMLHTGLHRNEAVEKPRFWCEVLGFTEFIRFPEDRSEHYNLLYMQMPGSKDLIEATYTVGVPHQRNWEHPCMGTYNMQATMDTLRARDASLMNPNIRSSVGRTKRWILNIRNSDGTKVEFSENFATK